MFKLYLQELYLNTNLESHIHRMLLSYYNKHHDQKQSRRNVLVYNLSTSMRIRQGRKARVITETEATEECSYLTCSLCLLSYLPYTTQHHLPLHSTVHNGLGFPTSKRNLENIFPAIPTLQTYEDYPQLRFSLPSHVLACIRLTKIHFDRG